MARKDATKTATTTTTPTPKDADVIKNASESSNKDPVVQEFMKSRMELGVFEVGKGFIDFHLVTLRPLVFVVGALFLLYTYLAYKGLLPSNLGPLPVYALIGTVLLVSLLQPLYRRLVPFDVRYPIFVWIEWVWGVLVTLNFMAFWAIPIFVQGRTWKMGASEFFRIPYRWLDEHPRLRAFASKYIYAQPRYADFFTALSLVVLFVVGSFIYLVYHQITYGYLPLWMIYCYYFVWVGFGGRGMGSAYTFAHKEGHFVQMYRPQFRAIFGNLCENWMGLLYGSVPHIFATSHQRIHHHLNGHKGDTIYVWDLDRSSFSDFMLYMHRMTLHTSGLSSLWYFAKSKDTLRYAQLMKGMIVFFLITPAVMYYMTGSWSFVFWVWFQPYICMTYFLAFLNYSQHGMIDYDEQGNNINCVNSLTIIGGQDDSFGEDDHIAHHYAMPVYFRDLPKYQESQRELWAKHHASIFKNCAIVEVAAFMLVKKWDLLANLYVELNPEGSPNRWSREKLMAKLEERSKRTEISHYDYTKFMEEQDLN